MVAKERLEAVNPVFVYACMVHYVVDTCILSLDNKIERTKDNCLVYD